MNKNSHRRSQTRGRLIALVATVMVFIAMLPVNAFAADHFLVYESILRMYGGLLSLPPGHTAVFVPKQRSAMYSRDWTSFPASRWKRYDVVRQLVDGDFNVTEYLVVDSAGMITSLYPQRLSRAVVRRISIDCDHQSIKCPFNYRVR
ncbi:MAG: hypothetical protein LBS11_03685 [Oscillospiraceae bacterium]|jgi:hypothetical protein|nr:hypothetical protein [Oscillospiraceae bacterium]